AASRSARSRRPSGGVSAPSGWCSWALAMDAAALATTTVPAAWASLPRIPLRNWRRAKSVMVDLLRREGKWVALLIAAPDPAVKSLHGVNSMKEVGRRCPAVKAGKWNFLVDFSFFPWFIRRSSIPLFPALQELCHVASPSRAHGRRHPQPLPDVHGLGPGRNGRQPVLQVLGRHQAGGHGGSPRADEAERAGGQVGPRRG